jgi:hypothetical protein
MDGKYDSSGRALALQAWSYEFKTQYHPLPPEKEKK